MRTRSVQVQGATLAVREWGDEGTPLLYWHGLNPFGALELNEAGPAWSADGFRVVAFAAPGITDPRPFADLEAYRPSRLAGLILRTAEELGIERFAYVGWSWGASIGVHLGARHGDRLDALVLLDAGHTDVTGDARRSLDDVIADFTAQQERYRFAGWDEVLTAARESRPRWRPALEERVRAGMREVDGAIVANSDPRAAAAAWYGLLQEQPSSTHAALAQSGLPILLVLAAENDTAVEAKRFRAAVPQAELRWVEAGHDLLADAPEETTALVAEWLAFAVTRPH